MHIAPLAVACVLTLACRPDRAPGVAARRHEQSGTDPTAPTGLRLAGCYVLRAVGPPAYQVHLAPGGDAHLIGPGATPNRTGDEWRWSVTTDSSFVVSWSGIDSWMEFDVHPRGGGWIADGVVTTTSAETHFTTPVERSRCQPGA